MEKVAKTYKCPRCGSSTLVVAKNHNFVKPICSNEECYIVKDNDGNYHGEKPMKHMGPQSDGVRCEGFYDFDSM